MSWLTYLVSLWLLTAAAALARQLPLKLYTVADGLAHNVAYCIVQDSRGFLWFCTRFGLSRFDGYRFTNYGPEHGLPNRSVLSLVESGSGAYWAGTTDGVYVHRPRPGTQTRFENVSFGATAAERRIHALLADKRGRLWVGTQSGLYVSDHPDAAEGPRFRTVEKDVPVCCLLEDSRGALWAASSAGLRWIGPEGVKIFSRMDGMLQVPISSLALDGAGRIWAGSWEGGISILGYDASGQPRVERTEPLAGHVLQGRVSDLLRSAAGTVWVATWDGLLEWRDGMFRKYGKPNGFADADLKTLGQDREGNLWVGTESSGVVKVIRGGFVTYSERDGLAHPRVRALFEGPQGELRVITHQLLIQSFSGGRLISVRPPLPSTITYEGWGWRQSVLEDRTGQWWIPTGQGLVRFAKPRKIEDLSSAAAQSVIGSRNGLPQDDVFRLYEDSRGDIWVATLGAPGPRLTRWERSTNSFHQLGLEQGLADRAGSALVFREDRDGQIWIGLDVGLARYRRGRFEMFGARDGLPAGPINDLILGRDGRLWMASGRGGLLYIEDPTARHPRASAITTAQGLASDEVSCIVEDQWGRIYAGTARGIDRVELRKGGVLLIRHYTASDGVVRGECTCALRDRQGVLWFGSLQGLSSLLPEPHYSGAAPQAWIGGIRIRGRPQTISDLGETQVTGNRTDASQNHVVFDYFAVSFRAGETLRYQYNKHR